MYEGKKQKAVCSCGAASTPGHCSGIASLPCPALPVLKVQAVMTSPGHVCALHLRAQNNGVAYVAIPLGPWASQQHVLTLADRQPPCSCKSSV